MTEVISYTRYSPRPEKEGDAERAAAMEDAESIQLQMDMNQRYATMKGLAITEVIKDPETSARKTPLFDREGGSRLKFLPKGSHVICMRLDRMFRSTVDGLQTVEHFQKRASFCTSLTNPAARWISALVKGASCSRCSCRQLNSNHTAPPIVLPRA
jgi:DNA invertase Pin-like site-specific DNA recombinase